MIMQEHDDNVFTKEKTDVEKYLLRIIQRYFETENNFSKASIESIIVESITRFKRYCVDKGENYLFSFNRQTGHIILDIDSFGGQSSFDKNTAYNKDFGNTADTICEGSDARLTNARIPYSHYHNVIEIDGLSDILKSFNIPDTIHSHKNQSIIDLLNYTGNTISIDLAIIEHVKSELLMYESKINSINVDMYRCNDLKINKLKASIARFISYLDDVSNNSVTGNNWIAEIKQELDDGINKYNQAAADSKKLFTKQEYNDLIDKISHTISMTDNGTFDIQLSISNIKTYNGNSGIILKTQQKTINNLSNALTTKCYFEYEDDDGNVIKNKLPFMFKDRNGMQIILQYYQDGDKIIFAPLFTSHFTGKAVVVNNSIFIGDTQIKPINDYIEYIDNNDDIKFIHYTRTNYDIYSAFKQITDENTMYFIGAHYDIDDEQYYNYDGTSALFGDSAIDENSDGPYICMQNGELYRTFSSSTGCVYKYSLPVLNDYYKNPKIYYEVFKEGV